MRSLLVIFFLLGVVTMPLHGANTTAFSGTITSVEPAKSMVVVSPMSGTPKSLLLYANAASTLTDITGKHIAFGSLKPGEKASGLFIPGPQNTIQKMVAVSPSPPPPPPPPPPPNNQNSSQGQSSSSSQGSRQNQGTGINGQAQGSPSGLPSSGSSLQWVIIIVLGVLGAGFFFWKKKEPEKSKVALSDEYEPKPKRWPLLLWPMGIIIFALCGANSGQNSSLVMIGFIIFIGFGIAGYALTILINKRAGQVSDDVPLSEVAGVVRNFQSRTEESGSGQGYTAAPNIIWTFRLERIDPATGDQLAPVPVEMRGQKYDGFISEGDKIQLYGIWQEGTMHRTRKVRNLTIGSDVRAGIKLI